MPIPKRLHRVPWSVYLHLHEEGWLHNEPRTTMNATRYGKGNVLLNESSWSSTAGSPSIVVPTLCPPNYHPEQPAMKLLVRSAVNPKANDEGRARVQDWIK